MENSTPDLGAHIRARRQSLGMTLEGLAAASGVSTTMLSEVERSVKNPTVKLAWQVARALDCSLTDLLQDEPRSLPTVVRANERRKLVDPDTGVERSGVPTELMQRGLEVAWYSIPPERSTGQMAPNRPGVLEHVVVVGGELALTVGGDEYKLAAGDHATYAPQTEVEYRSAGPDRCEFLLLSDHGRAGRRP